MSKKYDRHLQAFERLYAHAHVVRERAAAEQPINRVPDQSRVQDHESGTVEGFNDAKGWVRGFGKPHPHFDAGPSGRRYK
jgi:hypothetical protein